LTNLASFKKSSVLSIKRLKPPKVDRRPPKQTKLNAHPSPILGTPGGILRATAPIVLEILIFGLRHDTIFPLNSVVTKADFY
jgi:hypothetical protein